MDPFSSNTLAPIDIFLDDQYEEERPTNVQPAAAYTSVSLQSTRSWWRRATVFCFLLSACVVTIETTTLCQLALAICHFTRFICDIPTALQPSSLVQMCDWTPTYHNGNSYIFESCKSSRSVTPSKTDEKQDIAKIVPFMRSMKDSNIPFDLKNLASRHYGASIIPEFTSPTYNLTRPSFYAQAFQILTGFIIHKPNIFRASSVLDNDGVAGECWQFIGEGQIGIRFPQKVDVSAITLNNIPTPRVSLKATTNPGVVSAWGLLENLNDLELVENHDPFTLQKPIAISPKKADLANLPSYIHTSSYFLHLASFHYLDPPHSAWQYHLINVSIPIDALVLKFEGNQGAEQEAVTCVYSIGVHGNVI